MISKWSLYSIYQRKFEIMFYGKTKYHLLIILLLQTLLALQKTNKEYWSFACHDLQDLVHVL
jgi:hypothetical protein